MFLDVISRLPGCSGQASDAVSAHTQVKMKDAPKLFHLSEKDRPTIWIRTPKARRPQHCDSIDDPVVSLERNLCGDPLAGLSWERIHEKVLIEEGWEKVLGWECPYLHRKLQLFLSACVDDIKMAGKTQTVPKDVANIAEESRFERPSIIH